MTVIILLPSCLFSSFTVKKTGEDSKSTWELVSEAYTYALPLVIMDATKTSSTNTETPVTGRAPVNQLIHAQKLADAQSKLVVMPNVYDIQQKMQLMPLSAYEKGGEYTAPKGTYIAENDFVPVEKVLSMSPKEFFDTANTLMLANPPASADADVLKKFATINVGPGMTFDTSILTGDVAASWKKMLQRLRENLVADAEKYSVKLGQWKYFDAPIGDFGTEYNYRALVALAGLGANTVNVAIYPKTDIDYTGAVLTGEKKYVMYFDIMPPTLEGGFWSVTAYGSDDFLIDNPIDSYCVNDRSDFKCNEDGSLDITLSKEQPEDTYNWLPISDGEFHLYMRIYTPDMTALKNWTPPVVSVME